MDLAVLARIGVSYIHLRSKPQSSKQIIHFLFECIFFSAFFFMCEHENFRRFERRIELNTLANIYGMEIENFSVETIKLRSIFFSFIQLTFEFDTPRVIAECDQCFLSRHNFIRNFGYFFFLFHSRCTSNLGTWHFL